MRALFQNDTWQEIFGSIQKNRIRTIITMIGVLWGIFIYITLAGTSKGLDNGFEKKHSHRFLQIVYLFGLNKHHYHMQDIKLGDRLD